MTETKPKRRWFRFSIRDLLLIIVIAALAAGWWFDHQRINRLAVQQWEYRWEPVGAVLQSQSTLGDEGWEACAVSQSNRVLFKRPKR